MEQSSLINVLVLIDLLPDGERLVTLLRKAGLSLHAEAVRDECWLRERLLSQRWDLLLIHADNTRISPQQLGAVLDELQPDLLCLGIGSTAESLQSHIPQLVSVPCANPDDPAQSALLLRTLARELHGLQTRRRLRHSNAELHELQERHQLLLDTTSDAVAYLHDGMHVYVNTAYVNLFGHANPASLLNTAFLDLVDESALEATRQFLRQEKDVLKTPGQRIRSREHRLRALDATRLPTELVMHCDSIIYHSEPAQQITLRPLHGAAFRQSAHSQSSPTPGSAQPWVDAPADGFLSAIGQPASDTDLLHRRLQLGLENDDFQLLFQPIAGFTEDGLERYEVSLHLPDHTSASARLPAVATRVGLGERIDCLVLSRCLRLLCEADRPALHLVVNLSHDSLVSAGFLPWLRQQLHESQAASGRLVLQLSELDIVVTPSGQVEAFCQQLHALRIPLSVTRFGGSLEPFTYLPQQRATYASLDPSLVDGIDSDSGKLARLQETVNRLQASGLLTVSRVDRMELLPALWEARVNFVQGDCLQAADIHMDFTFVRDEEITLSALH